MGRNPAIRLERDMLDNLSDVLAASFLLMSISYTLYYYPDLPAQVPIHYNLAGEVDGYGSKEMVFMLIAVMAGCYALLFFVARIPHMHNYMVEITEVNAEAQYRNSVRMLRTMNVIITGYFGFLLVKKTLIATGMATGLGGLTTPIFLGLLTVTMVYFIARSFRLR